MNFAGIDYSMSCPAITVGPSKNFSKCHTFFYSGVKKHQRKFKHDIYGLVTIPYSGEMERFDNVSEWAMAIFKRYNVQKVCLEGYAMGAKGKVFNIAENTGILKYKMWKAGISFTTPSPMTVKKSFSGKGNAGKELMYNSFKEKTSVDLSTVIDSKIDGNPISDIVDSYAMLEYGFDQEFFQ